MSHTRDMIELTSNHQVFDAYVSLPAGEIKGGIIVIHEIWALNDHTKDIADRFAKEGYVALAPNLLQETDIAKHAPTLQLDYFNPEKRNEAQPKLRALMAPTQEPEFAGDTLAKVRVCFETLYEREDVKQKVAITGYCFGGSYSFSLAVAEPRLKLALPFYGHTTTEVSELAKIACPVRAFYGEKDERLMDGLDELQAAMEEANVDFEVQVYEGTGHAFFNDTNPYAYNEAAATDAWQQVLRLLERAL